MKRKSLIRIKSGEAQKEEVQEIHFGNEPATQEGVSKFWNEYAMDIKSKSGGFTGSILTSCEPKLLNNSNTILVVFRSETSLIEFEKLSPGVLTYLKSNLKNNYLEFKTEVNVEKAKKVLYSNKDKFDHLAKQHPKLEDWAVRLGIELK